MVNATLTSTGSVQVAIKESGVQGVRSSRSQEFKESGVQGVQGVFFILKFCKHSQSASFLRIIVPKTLHNFNFNHPQSFDLSRVYIYSASPN
ncbi:hypothetical protein NIES73_40910 [Sphaerospermopsis kisseleviana NIES-73]|nr:hypothetical protein NIES73_40910 [Sphaerospermopsis kisseleviana NIES-73]